MNKRSLFTSSFKEYAVFFFKLVLMFLIVVYLVSRFIPSYTGGFCASLIDKVNRLESIEEPKIVLIGNSNLAYGIDSELIEEHFQMPVVNMGLHGALGNVFHEEMAKLNVCEGDIYIICHTDYCDLGVIEDPVLAWVTVENHPKLWRILRTEDLLPLFKEFPVYLRRCVDRYTNGSRNGEEGRNMFNEYGDRCDDRTEPEDMLFQEGSVYIPNITGRVMDRLNRLNAYLTERGAVLLIAGYPIGDGEYTPDKAYFEGLQKGLEENLDFPVISDFTDYMFDYKYFYNSTLHLTDEGTVLRTQQLIEDLDGYLNGKDKGE